MKALERAGMALAGSRLGGIAYHRICRPIDTVLIPLSRGRLSLGPADTLLLTTTGARSGRPRKAALAFLRRGDDLVIIASKGGAPRHPGWYHNLRAQPRAIVETRDGVEERVARETHGDERDRLFAEAAARYPTYATYERRAEGRRIPVMVLSRPE
ncbi:MAG: nitroreductase/quinone reductase family protein [Myxococcota bacterium]|nr:nitroreductase/quinone reductase family protein [Myxococcota bacterium]